MSNPPDKLEQELLVNLLRQVARSFHLSLQLLPGQIRTPISLAYLLARTSDTIADTNRLPPQARLAALERFAEGVSGTQSIPSDFHQLAANQGDPAERLLLQRTEDSLALLGRLEDSDRGLVRRVLATIISGQELDLKRFANASESNIVGLATAEDLDDYTYRVAGCVGEFWTRICFANLTPRCDLPEPGMIELGVRYGKGLQLVNILRDLPRDLRQGRCYLPAAQLESAGLVPADLLNPASEAILRPAYMAWLDRAEKNLRAGWEYTNHYPRSLARVRISCALPVLIGLRTLRLLRTGRVLDPANRIKIARGEVRKLVLQAFLRHPFNSLWNQLVPEAG